MGGAEGVPYRRAISHTPLSCSSREPPRTFRGGFLGRAAGVNVPEGIPFDGDAIRVDDSVDDGGGTTMGEDQRNPDQAPVDPYAPSPSQHATPYSGGWEKPPMPSAVMWYTVYCVLMALMYLLTMAMGALILFGPDDLRQSMAQSRSSVDPRILGTIYIVMGMVFVCPYVVGALAPKRPWAWIYGIVLIAFGMTTICCLPLTIPLMIFWIKPEVQRYYGRSA